MITQDAIDIGKANEVLRQAKELIGQAYRLICTSPAAKKHLKFDCTVGWKSQTWNALNEEYSIEDPMSKETYHLRAFDHFCLQYGSDISLDGMSTCSGS